MVETSYSKINLESMPYSYEICFDLALAKNDDSCFSIGKIVMEPNLFEVLSPIRLKSTQDLFTVLTARS